MVVGWAREGLGVARSARQKQELRHMSRIDVLRTVAEIFEFYRGRGDSGRITIDVRGGRALWVKPVITDCPQGPQHSCTLNPLGQLETALREFEALAASGTITIMVCAGEAVELSREIELDKVRVAGPHPRE